MITQSVIAIVERSDISANNTPFTVTVLGKNLFSDLYFCTGALIGPKNILTTAGCIVGSSAHFLKIRIESLEHTADGKAK